MPDFEIGVSVEHLRRLLRDTVLDCLKSVVLTRITLDLDGSVQVAKRRAEATAVGFNKKNKGTPGSRNAS